MSERAGTGSRQTHPLSSALSPLRGRLAALLIAVISLLCHGPAFAGGSSDILVVPEADVWVLAMPHPDESYLLLEPSVLNLVWTGVQKEGFQYLSAGDRRYLIYWDEEDCSLVGLDAVSRRYWVTSQ